MMLCTYCNSQSVAQGRVVDAETKEPLIYCHIMIAVENRGTITNEDGEFEKKNVELGISDGINVEITEGVKEGDKIKVWNKASKDNEDEEEN